MSFNNYSIDYSWEDQVNAMVNNIILKFYKEFNPEKVKEIENIVKEYLSEK
jgi:hypothetical protein